MIRIDPRNIQIKLVRGRSQVMALRVGQIVPNPPPPAGMLTWNFIPQNISGWNFGFTMRTNYTYKQPTIALAYSPIVNLADPTQGQLLWNILAKDTQPLATGNYVWDMVLITTDNQPRFFCNGTAALADNVTDLIATPITSIKR